MSNGRVVRLRSQALLINVTVKKKKSMPEWYSTFACAVFPTTKEIET